MWRARRRWWTAFWKKDSKAEALDRILTEHPEMEFVQLQINYADWEDPDIESRKCYETARKHGKPVIIMELGNCETDLQA